ncbi:MAG: hypothetical protein R6V62_05960 [Candidatus Fermentibacteraceae bacterium]
MRPKGGEMEGVKNGLELAERLRQASGEDIIHCGWGMLGIGNVFVGVSSGALVLEFITITYKTRLLRRIPFEEMELIYAAKGDASTPGFLKLNIQGAMSHAMTGTLLVKVRGEKLLNILFNKMPRFDRNDGTPFLIAEYVGSINESLVRPPDEADARSRFNMSGCLTLFAVLTGVFSVLLALLLGYQNKWDEGSMIAGGVMGVVLAAIFAPLGHWIKRIFTGRG